MEYHPDPKKFNIFSTGPKPITSDVKSLTFSYNKNTNTTCRGSVLYRFTVSRLSRFTMGSELRRSQAWHRPYSVQPTVSSACASLVWLFSFRDSFQSPEFQISIVQGRTRHQFLPEPSSRDAGNMEPVPAVVTFTADLSLKQRPSATYALPA
ncbi:hypothetical protein RRG08_008477 [Elysia crispata]|uniref:Uncharacterized protein n=1 Tax=Elysia crispata TaxID=231223 RepID=A0AAE1DBQ8_9GAST|nr:hypothetical protein RRG08_008477 [Elysia crispata]